MKLFVGVALLVALLVAVGGFILFKKYSVAPLSQTTNKQLYFTAANGDTYPFTMSWEKNYMLVSGIVQSQSLLTDKRILVKVPSLTDQNGTVVAAALPDIFNVQNSYILVLELPKGKFQAPQKWTVMKLPDFIKYVVPGHPVALYIDVNETEAQNIINKTTSDIAQPITHFIVGVY